MNRIASIVTIGMLAVSATAQAQSRPQTRDGLAISFGLGGGSATITCAGCGSVPRETGSSGYLRIGGALSPSLVLSGESNGWVKTINGSDVTMGSLMAVAQWYPAPSTGFYVKGGAGIGAYQEKDNTGDASAVGGAFQAGAGYDIRLGSNFSLTPYMNYLNMANSEVKVGGSSTGSKVGSNNLQYGLGFTWH